MDDFFVWGLFIVIAIVGGWVLGVVGFFSARRARAEIQQLRLRLDALAGAPAAAPQETFAGPVPSHWEAHVRRTAPPAVQAETLAGIATPEAMPPVTPEAEPPPPETPEAATPAPEILEPAAAAARPGAKDWDIEALLTLRWGVWLGSAALLLAGVFLVRYAVDEGLLGPATRCVMAALLGVVLLFAAEWLKRRDPPSAAAWQADQAPPALAAGGVAVLFGAAYSGGIVYGLVPPIVAFVLMAAAALIGLAVSLRHGQLVAAVGIVGAFVTPSLVQTADPSLPGLFAYLLFVTAAALSVVRYTAWTWLGWATTIAGAFWVMATAKVGLPPDRWPSALFVPAAATLNLALLPPAALDHKVGRRLAWIPFAGTRLRGLAADGDGPGLDGQARRALALAPGRVESIGRAACRSPALDLRPAVPDDAALMGAAGLEADR